LGVCAVDRYSEGLTVEIGGILILVLIVLVVVVLLRR